MTQESTTTGSTPASKVVLGSTIRLYKQSKEKNTPKIKKQCVDSSQGSIKEMSESRIDLLTRSSKLGTCNNSQLKLSESCKSLAFLSPHLNNSTAKLPTFTKLYDTLQAKVKVRQSPVVLTDNQKC